jgi:hypothetical protein
MLKNHCNISINGSPKSLKINEHFEQYESQSKREKNLQRLQGGPSQRPGAGNMQKSKAQTTPGID